MGKTVREKLRKISASMVERFLVKHKQKTRIRGTSGTKTGRPLRKLVTVMTHFECAVQPPRFFQIDLVQHNGGDPAGEFCYTMTMTDVATGWTVHYPLKNKAHKWVRESLEDAQKTFVFPFRSIHSDSGSEFLNYALVRWCQENAISFTKGRTSRKNDNKSW